MRYTKSLRDIIGADEARQWQRKAIGSREQPRPDGQQMPPPMSAAQLQQMAQRIGRVLARQTGTANRWNGTISLQPMPGAAGRKEWDCRITLLDDRAFLSDPAQYWPALNHEMLHALSVGLTPAGYLQYRGWEEGVFVASTMERGKDNGESQS